MAGNLDTTNTLLGIMAAVSVLEALLLIGVGVGGFLIYRRVMQLVTDLEARQIAPLREKVDAILADVKAVTARVNHDAERVDLAIHGTIDRVDETAERVRSSLRTGLYQAAGVAQGIRAIVRSVFTNHRHQPPATAAGRAAS